MKLTIFINNLTNMLEYKNNIYLVFITQGPNNIRTLDTTNLLKKIFRDILVSNIKKNFY